MTATSKIPTACAARRAQRSGRTWTVQLDWPAASIVTCRSEALSERHCPSYRNGRDWSRRHGAMLVL